MNTSKQVRFSYLGLFRKYFSQDNEDFQRKPFRVLVAGEEELEPNFLMDTLKKAVVFSLFIIFGVVNAQDLPKPTSSQLVWQQAELGVIFHYDLHVFDGKKYNQGENRIVPLNNYNDLFSPDSLDTDQWIRAAKSAGAKFAIITATHETGFALYQSDVNPYSLKAIDWRDGNGDIVQDFVNSCRKYGLRPGIYVGIRWNSFLGVHDFRVEGESRFAAHRQQAYKKMCEGMVDELTSRYGDLFMIWFDGGASDPKTYGADVLPVVEKNQPNCLFYHNAERADFRWGGSETGTVPYPCWSTYPFPYSHANNTEYIAKDNFKLLKHGDSDGQYYMPAMSDAPLRGHQGRHEWFWEPDDEKHIYPVDHLVDMYKNSVGHNSTLILGLTPDPSGLLPKHDADTLKAFGDKIKSLFEVPIAFVEDSGEKELSLSVPKDKTPKHLIVKEDLTFGQRVQKFEIQAFKNNTWQVLFAGTSIGHKFIYQIESPTDITKVRLVIKTSKGTPKISYFGVS
ncbi:alpha-L-fucosidase [Sphingobacterium shayense]|uniref:alpha-L-fucosidase n=1 Tax=Sphingobacterium shayense TaxID=626343 RepID=UPI001C131B4A|nr:alpha-L-fucosidase [Sphingobacterium shayense]